MPILNGAPQNLKLGVLDNSGTTVFPSNDPLPKLFMPLVFFYAEKGTTAKIPTTGAKLVHMYGANSFDPKSSYYNHASKLVEVLFGGGQSAIMSKRIVPSDAADPSDFTLWIDILPLTFQACERNSDGAPVMNGETCVIDADGPNIDGYMIKYILSNSQNVVGDPGYGAHASKTGTMDDGSGGASTMYPLFDFKASEKGSHYNNLGIAIKSLTSDEIAADYIDVTKALPYALKLFERPDENSTGVVRKNLFSSTSSTFTLKDGVLDPYTEKNFNLSDIFPGNWYNEKNVLKPLVYNEFEAPYVYKENIASVVDMFITSEESYVSETPTTWHDGEDAATITWFDFTTEDSELLIEEQGYLFNIFTLKSSTGVPYFSVRFDTDTEVPPPMGSEVNINEDSVLYMGGGDDGTMNNTNFETAVVEEMTKYLDPNSEVMNYAINNETCVINSGFTLTTAKELSNIIAIRKNTNVFFGTHDEALGTAYATLESERAIAVSLSTRLKLSPESEFFGTSVARGTIIGGSGVFRDGSINKRSSNVYDFALKLARFCGNAENKFRSQYRFDGGENAIIEDLVDIQPSFVPDGIKPLLWDEGLNYPEPMERNIYFYPAYQTVYGNDTSVLNAPLMAIAIAYLNTVAEEAWRNFTGFMGSKAQLADGIVAYVNKKTANAFTGYFEVTPSVEFTEEDIERGYSWTLVIKIKGNVMPTVQTTRIEAYRFDNA